MFDLNSLIGLELKIAQDNLKQAGFKNIFVILNSEHNDKCDTNIVCAVRKSENGITLICGEFLINLKG